MSFAESCLQHASPLWERMLEHPFLLRTRDGRLSEETFDTWLRQDYLFVRAARPFLGFLVGRAPRRQHDGLVQALAALGEELELFRERAAALGVELEDVKPGFVCHAYVQYLFATVQRDDYPEAFTVYYAAEKAYHESWKVVREGLDPSSPWQPFVENWAGEEFGAFVEWLEGELEALAETASQSTRSRMRDRFEETVRYEIAFWQMALEGPGWPGIGGAPNTG